MTPLSESREELLGDVEGLKGLSGSFLEAAQDGGARASKWWAALEQGMRSWAEKLLKPGNQVGGGASISLNSPSGVAKAPMGLVQKQPLW